ncbi:hypothetical protein K7I13_08665 [Brucepastera parasyntrophica]|uniref:tetratricopeptide repeat protein n=1 Tax=Brucepastera parasyntrophica TaxID=2880008 RepID=UPI00210A0A9C|nr:hypothetical protein [Brucepastera parasyntrophica]ULQ58634.1 hypothetical protein K7I13_08665 [Brucepastera parasyntrophica]
MSKIKSDTPIVRSVAWISLIPQLLVLGLFILLFYFLNTPNPLIFGSLAYLLVSFSLRNFLAKDHREGMKLTRMEKYDEAIPVFEKSVNFFTTYNWIDKYRYLVMLNSSKYSFKEMGLCNIAFCYSQTGNAEMTKKYYEIILEQYPNNGIAQAGLNLINSIQDDKNK